MRILIIYRTIFLRYNTAHVENRIELMQIIIITIIFNRIILPSLWGHVRSETVSVCVCVCVF